MSDYEVRTYSEVGGEDRSGLPDQIARQRRRVRERLSAVDHVLAVMSGKGGVGKSFVAAGVAAALQGSGRRVGLLDADLDGPTAPSLLGVEPRPLDVGEDGVAPVETPAGLALMSSALLLEEDAPLRWRGPDEESFAWRGAQERGVLREFLSDVAWGGRDVLVVDLPPGSARLEQLLGLVPRLDGCLAVTLPSEAARASVERSLSLADRREVPLAGVVENMSGYACGGCGEERPLFPGDAGRRLAGSHGTRLVGSIPFDPAAARRADAGEMDVLLEETRAGEALGAVASEVERWLEDGREADG